MDTYNTRPTEAQPPLPTRELWRALLVVFNHYLKEEFGLFRSYPDGQKPPDEVIEAVRLLDCSRDLAVQEGWLDDRESEG